MGAGYFFARPRRKAGLFMGGENDGAAAQAQVAGEPQAQGDQATQAAVTAGLQGAGAAGDGGDVVARAHKDYEAALAERDARIAEIEAEMEQVRTTAPRQTTMRDFQQQRQAQAARFN